MPANPRSGLVRQLAVRISVVAALSLALTVFYIAGYLLRPRELYQQTLDTEADAITRGLARGEDPANWPRYRDYPRSYAYRVFDKNHPEGQRLLSSGNAGLLPPIPPRRPGEMDPVLRLDERFEALGPSNGKPSSDRWMLTTRSAVDGHGLWVQVAMIGDPAWRWRTALADEAMNHVVVPAGVLVPGLTVAVMLVVRRALRPLTLLAEQAEALGQQALRGRPLMPLSGASLPRELAAVVSAVNAMLQAIDRALTRQREFAADAAHELRTPLAVLRLQIAELPRGPVVQQLDEELAALGRLIEQLLRFAQAEQVMADRRQTMDVVAVARQTCEDLAPLAFARQQELEFVAPEAPVLRAGNPTLLGVAIRNLIENALRAAPVATTVTVSVGDPGVVVEDRGPGVPDAQKQAIFRRLWRGDPGRTEGAGIGLALVERIAELHEGSVEVEDRPGGGARFVLHLAEGAPSA